MYGSSQQRYTIRTACLLKQPAHIFTFYELSTLALFAALIFCFYAHKNVRIANTTKASPTHEATIAPKACDFHQTHMKHLYACKRHHVNAALTWLRDGT
jgi:hypothetical protein